MHRSALRKFETELRSKVYRAMDLREIADLQDFIAEHEDPEIFRNLRPLLADDQSNHVFIYIDGPMKNKLAYYDHEDCNPLPAFRSVEHGLQALNATPTAEWHELSLNYPAVTASDAEIADDLQCIEQIEHDIANVAEAGSLHARHLQCCRITLTPPAACEEIYRYLESTDMFVQAHAAWYLGFHRVTAATQRLYQVAAQGTHNGKLSALDALYLIGTPEAKACLAELKQILPEGFTHCITYYLRADA